MKTREQEEFESVSAALAGFKSNSWAKVADRVYFKIKAFFTFVDYEETYNAGFNMGYEVAKSSILAELNRRSLYNWKPAELRLGYDYAVAVAKDVRRREC